MTLETIVCHCCLSRDRVLMPLLQYENILFKIMEIKKKLSPQFLLCWECLAILHKITLFKQRVRKAQLFLWGNEAQLCPSTLSKLGIRLIESYNCAIECNKNNMHLEEKVEIKEEPPTMKKEFLPSVEIEKVENFENNNDFQCSNNDRIELREEKLEINNLNSVTVGTVYESDKKKTMKNITQSKRGKYELSTFDIEKKILKIPTNIETYKFYMETARNSKWFKKFKYKCLKCLMTFSNTRKRNYQQHEYSCHFKGLKYTCNVCLYTFKCPDKMVSHLERHKFLYECTICQVKTCTIAYANDHFDKSHLKAFSCKKCDMVFNNRTEFRKHYRDMHEKFVCNDCGKISATKEVIRKHIRNHHMLHSCTSCNTTYKNYKSYITHMRQCHRPQQKVYCVECDAHFSNSKCFKLHVASSKKHEGQSGKGLFKCSECDKMYRRRTFMMNHYRHVHLKKTKHYCQPCDKYFLISTQLLHHNRVKHQRLPPRKDKFCDVCHRGFSTNRILFHHMLTHTGERPHACNLCPARFTQKWSLKVHQRSVHGTKEAAGMTRT